jgi:hypothetical protein
MTTVFRQAQDATRSETLVTRALFYAREIPGLLSGVLQEHFRRVAGSYDWISLRRFDMRPEFRFPRSTVFLMLVILACVVVSLEWVSSCT